MTDRMDRYGNWDGTCGENIDFGRKNKGMQHIVDLMTDDGVLSRGHRTNIFNENFLVVGIGCGPHKVYGGCCVLDYAARFTEKGK